MRIWRSAIWAKLQPLLAHPPDPRRRIKGFNPDDQRLRTMHASRPARPPFHHSQFTIPLAPSIHLTFTQPVAQSTRHDIPASEPDMTMTNIPAPPALIEQLIVSVRQQRGIIDRDLAAIYGVETRALNQAVKRNLDRFPEEFMFRLTRAEVVTISQSVTSLRSLKFSRRAHLFTEHGALMAATVLNSP